MTPGEIPVACWPIAIALELPPSSSMPSLAPSSANFCSIKRGEIFSATAKNKSFRSRSIATAVRESGFRPLPGETLPSRNQIAWPPTPHFACAKIRRPGRSRRPQVRRQLVVKPQQIGVLPNVTDDVVGHHRLHPFGEIACHPKPPGRFRGEQRRH